MSDVPPLSSEVLKLIPPSSKTTEEDGFVRDAAGARHRRVFRGGSADKPGIIQHAAPQNSWEWIPLTWAVMTAKGSINVVELGAGWGPWLSRCYALARTLGIEKRHVFAVEAEPAHFGYLEQQMVDNGIAPEDHTLVQGLIAERAGVALFPLTETPEKSWGLRQVGREGQSLEDVVAAVRAEPIENEPGYYRLPKVPHKYAVQRSLSLAELVGDTPVLDFVHVDIQGNETKVLPPSIDLLNERVRVLVVGTHSHDIEAELRDCFKSNDWICYHDSVMHHDNRGCLRDGNQVWINPRFTPQPPEPPAL